MKILLIRPHINKNIVTLRNFMFGEPLGLACVATIMKELNHDVKLVDFMVEEKENPIKYLREFQPDIVGITSQCTDVENVLNTAKITKEFDDKIKVIVGGVQASIYPNSFFSEYVDYIFKSTTRENYSKLLQEVENKLKDENFKSNLIEGIYSKDLNYINNGEFCYNEYIIPDRDCTKEYRKHYKYIGYQPCAIVQTAYGCRNKCNFCVRWRMEGKLNEIELDNIIKQFEEIQEPHIFICDNDFLINRKRLEMFCDLLEEKKINKKLICYGSVKSVLEKEDIFPRLRKNGLVAVIMGYEAFEDNQLDLYEKGTTTYQNIEATKILQKNDIASWGSFILHPDWSKEDFKKLKSYIRILKPELLSFSPLIPHPLTPLYEEYKDRLIYDESDYEKWNFGDVIIMPSKMSLKEYYKEVLKFMFAVNFSMYSIKYILKEFPISNMIKIVFGFRNMIKIYVTNYFKNKAIKG